MSKSDWIDCFCDKASKGEAAFFIGAGVSVPYGLPDFEGLIRTLSEKTLGLRIDGNLNYPEIAQYIVNELKGREEIIKDIKFLFDSVKFDSSKSKYLDYIAKSHVNTIYTTNFDTFIEDCFKENNIQYNIASCDEDLKQCFEIKNVKDVIKIHGDIERKNIVITKSDYEDFSINNKLFVRRLEQDLLTKSLLFIGYSYNDANIQNIVNNVRQLIGEKRIHQQHYMLLPKPRKITEQRLQEYWIRDLQRYGIQVHLIKDFSELEDILKLISFKSKGKTVYVTGSHRETNKNVEKFATELGKRLAEEDVVLNYGQSTGIGQFVFNAFGKQQIDNNKTVNRRLNVFPNPYIFCEDWDDNDFLLDELRNLRENLLKETRIMITFPGGKGTEQEVELAEKMGTLIIPVITKAYDEKRFYDYIMHQTTIIENLERIDNCYYEKLKLKDISIKDILSCVKKTL